MSDGPKARGEARGPRGKRCPNAGDGAHGDTRCTGSSAQGPRGGFFYGYDTEGRKVYFCTDCALMFREDGSRVRSGVSVIGDEPSGYRMDGHQVFAKRGAS